MDHDFLGLKKELPPRRSLFLLLGSFILPLGLWCLVSYTPWIWHPLVHVVDPGEVEFFSEGMDVPKATFAEENANALKAGQAVATGFPVNPAYLPSPHKVARALYTGFLTEPRLPGEPWLHQSLARSCSVIFWGFVLSSVVGVPLGILCGAFRFFARLIEPFIEFFRYLPAPAFGALCVAILGIHDAPKIGIIVIGTLFQQVLVIANTVRKTDPALIEAAQTLGAGKWQIVTRVVIPASITNLYTDMRILLGWAWTYLIVSEVVGTTSGITYFINQQARYRQFDNVYAAIIIIGLIGFISDLLLARFGRVLFPWQHPATGPGRLARFQAWMATPGRGLFPGPPPARPSLPPAA